MDRGDPLPRKVHNRGRFVASCNAGWTKLHNDVLKKTISANLTPREREVARFVVYGFKNSQIANKLFISEAAVKTTIRSIKNKTNAEKRHQFIDFI